ncbi:MAG: hypothetical protein JWO11_895 [Nocardioides sp.]|nr:hypothetical protein [Nocardioides sp.]
MTNFDGLTQDHVRAAIDECDEIGAEVFLDRYGFGQAREYVLWHEDRSYDSKAIVGVAYRHLTGRPAGSDEFSGGRDGAAKVLRDLGFEVRSGVDDEPDGGQDPTSSRKASEVGAKVSRSAWAEVAREELIKVAHRYHAVVTYKELALTAQSRSGIHTKQLMNHWIGDVLGRVARDCGQRGEPILSSLCVDASGSVGTGYAVAIKDALGEAIADPDDHAARERLRCYAYFGATLPLGGGVPALTPKLAATRTRERKARVAAQPVAVCALCNMAVPATGVCDNCG